MSQINPETGMTQEEVDGLNGLLSPTERASAVAHWIELHWRGASPTDEDVASAERLILNAFAIEQVRAVEIAAEECDLLEKQYLKEAEDTHNERMEHFATGAKQCAARVRSCVAFRG